MSRQTLMLEAVKRGKYAPLFHHLTGRGTAEWSTTFAELESILGFKLPNSAHLYRPWWANDAKSGHSQSMAWTAAGWKTANVDLEAGTLTFQRI
jgi:hypothetical protein